MEQEAEEAFERLSAARSFSDGWNGWGKPTWQAFAFDTLFGLDHAASLFEQLVENGELPGQLFGLCGLYLTSKYCG